MQSYTLFCTIPITIIINSCNNDLKNLKEKEVMNLKCYFKALFNKTFMIERELNDSKYSMLLVLMLLPMLLQQI